MARLFDDEILPIWSRRFSKMILRQLSLPEKPMVLDFCCATGDLTLEVTRRMEGKGRIIAIDPSSALLDVARQKAGELSGRTIFFRTESFGGRLAFADDVYDCVLSNAAVLLFEDPGKLIREFARVTAPGGTVLVTCPLAGTYREFFDIYREVLTKSDAHELLDRLEAHVAEIPTPETMLSWFEDAGLPNVTLEKEEFSLLFKSAREFFFAPVIEFGPLSKWKDLAGKGNSMQEIFWHIKEAIDAYFGDRAFEITVVAGCFCAAKTDPEDAPTTRASSRELSGLRVPISRTAETAPRTPKPRPAPAPEPEPEVDPDDLPTEIKPH